jgi:Flp pilus assembly protein TadB
MDPRVPRSSRPQSNAGTAIALFGLLLISGAILGLMSLVLPQVAGVLLVILLVFVLPMALHYLVWGWWMSQMKDSEEERDERIED